MLMQLLAQRNILASKVLLSSFKCSFYNLASVSTWSPLFKVWVVTSKYRSSTRVYVTASDNLPVICNDNASTHQHARRTYQVLVAATREMGIGKDGKLPWRLPSDLKFFKKLTMTTSDPGKKNAVVMGRKTWESIPLMYRPLPGRLNVVLTRSKSFSIASAEKNVVICGSIMSALELLAETPYGSSIEKVFVIGGGQILRETLNAPECDAIHITEIETSIECDTFIPAIDFSLFQPWYLSQPLVENNIQFCFATYVRTRNSSTGTLAASSELECNGSSNFNKFEMKSFTLLPQFVFERPDEFAYLRLVQKIISSGNQKDDGTGTGILSKYSWKVLQEKGVDIWHGCHLDRQLLDYKTTHAQTLFCPCKPL